MATRVWSDIPYEILEQVANRLGLIDLLRFRFVCKNFRSASSGATAEIQTFPWFLVYGENNTPQCSLFACGQGVERYKLDIPELQDATCLASNQGWLLVFRRGSMFFFCPFSNVKMDLPNLPCSELKTEHVGAFSSPPWSKDCVVFVVTRCDVDWMEINVLRRGCYNWDTQKVDCRGVFTRELLCNVTATVCYGDALYYFHQGGNTHVFSSNPNLVEIFVLSGKGKESPPSDHALAHVPSLLLKEVIGVKDDASISICGTFLNHSLGNLKVHGVMHNEMFKESTSSSCRMVKAVWIHPRFYHISTMDPHW